MKMRKKLERIVVREREAWINFMYESSGRRVLYKHESRYWYRIRLSERDDELQCGVLSDCLTDRQTLTSSRHRQCFGICFIESERWSARSTVQFLRGICFGGRVPINFEIWLANRFRPRLKVWHKTTAHSIATFGAIWRQLLRNRLLLKDSQFLWIKGH